MKLVLFGLVLLFIRELCVYLAKCGTGKIMLRKINQHQHQQYKQAQESKDDAFQRAQYVGLPGMLIP